MEIMMDDMVTRVVEVLNEKNPFMTHNRILHSRIPKKRPRKRFIPRPAKTTGEREVHDRSKEHQRKEIKQRHPNTPLKWTGHRWELKAREHEDRKEEIEERYGLVPLIEISLRTVAIGGYLAKVKQYSSKVDSYVARMKSLASDLSRADTPEKKARIESELWKTDADVLWNMRKMNIYSALVSASGGLGAPRETVKLLKKIRGKKR